MGKCQKEVLLGAHILCEHVLPDKLTDSAACRTDNFHIPPIRV